MNIYLDSNIVVYFIENSADWGSRASSRILDIQSRGDVISVSDLTRMECRIRPLRDGNTQLLQEYDSFFQLAGVRVLAISPIVCDRAAAIRASLRYKPIDALHLASALQAGCDRFLTNDNRLSGFPDMSIELLA